MKKHLLILSIFFLTGSYAMGQNQDQLLLIKKKAQDSVSVAEGQYIGVKSTSGMSYEGPYQRGQGQRIQIGVNALSLDEVQKISTLQPSLSQNKGPLFMIFGILGTAVGAGAMAVGATASDGLRPVELLLGASTMAVGVTMASKGIRSVSSRSYPSTNWNYRLY